MWPRKKEAPPAHKFGIGERVRLIDCAEWDNQSTRHLIGREAIVVGFGMPEEDRQYFPLHFYYKLEVEGKGEFYAPDQALKRLDDDSDPFAEPRDVSDDTPNKVVTWDKVAWKPKREVA